MSGPAAAEGPWGGVAPNASAPVPAEPQPPQPGLEVTFTGRRGALFWLALKCGFLTVLTLGIYRFWMKTRLRRWYWSAIRPGGDPLEYVGDPIEKLLGFCIAVVILTFYIGIVNLLLMFVSFAVFSVSWVGYAASFLGIVPIWFYARYRARRYVLARTRWRGVRFGLEPGAWGYALRALVHWIITILSLGLLWPRMTFALEKYRTDRTFFGSARLTQGGNWWQLYRAAWPFALSLLSLVGGIIWLLLREPLLAQALDEEAAFQRVIAGLTNPWVSGVEDERALLILPLALAGMLFGAIYYNWTAKRIMARHKSARGITFDSALSGVRISFIYVLGNFVAYLFLFLGLFGLVLLAVATYGFGDLPMGEDGMSLLAAMPRWLAFVGIALLYLSLFLLWGVLHQTFVTFPIMRHMARTTRLPEVAGLHLISQRERDAFAEAEGFAEALDLGAAI
jgi:hypothetical protein